MTYVDSTRIRKMLQLCK